MQILAALLKEEAVTSLGENLHWKLTLNDYKASTEDALAEAGGALFPWHTDLAANGEITAISTLLAPAIMEFAPHADAPGAPTRIVAKPGTLVLLSGDARWKGPPRDAPSRGRGQGADFPRARVRGVGVLSHLYIPCPFQVVSRAPKIQLSTVFS